MIKVCFKTTDKKYEPIIIEGENKEACIEEFFKQAGVELEVVNETKDKTDQS